jgi:hypothetical protein
MHQTQGPPSNLKNTLLTLRAQVDPNTMIVGELNILLPPVDKSFRQKMNK